MKIFFEKARWSSLHEIFVLVLCSVKSVLWFESVWIFFGEGKPYGRAGGGLLVSARSRWVGGRMVCSSGGFLLLPGILLSREAGM